MKGEDQKYTPSPRCRRCGERHSKGHAGCGQSLRQLLDAARARPQEEPTIPPEASAPPADPGKQPWEVAADQDRAERKRGERISEFQGGVLYPSK